jgi:hypothetical protein
MNQRHCAQEEKIQNRIKCAGFNYISTFRKTMNLDIHGNKNSKANAWLKCKGHKDLVLRYQCPLLFRDVEIHSHFL